MTNLKSFLAATTLTASLTIAGCASPSATNATGYEYADVLEMSERQADLSTFAAAIYDACLEPTVSGPGPVTVFAPSDSAFEKLPEGTVSMLLEERNETQLRGILTYHMVGTTFTGADLSNSILNSANIYTITTLNGQSLTARIDDGEIVLVDNKGNEATIVATDINGSNGVVHVIDTVLMPR